MFTFQIALNDILFCLEDCDVPMGLSNPLVISDRQLTASSFLDINHNPSRGRIYANKDGSLAGGWSPR